MLLHARRDEVRLPNDATSVREWIEHPGATAVVPLFDDGSTVLIRQYRYAPGREFLEVPAGKMDKPGEDPEAVGRRELLEEVELEAETWTYLGKTFPCIGYSDEVIHLFLAEDLTEGDGYTEDDEFVVPVRMPFEEAVGKARSGEILDAKSCVAILLASEHVNG